MISEQPMTWLGAWFSDRAPQRDLAPTENYFEAEVIDSFAVIELIEAIETHFNCRFDDTDFQDRRFTSVAGLAEIIAEKTRGVDG
jgi:D-alanine--poly(phosphoribitol) ligase subunit 2